jgi:hypothetical protein
MASNAFRLRSRSYRGRDRLTHHWILVRRRGTGLRKLFVLELLRAVTAALLPAYFRAIRNTFVVRTAPCVCRPCGRCRSQGGNGQGGDDGKASRKTAHEMPPPVLKLANAFAFGQAILGALENRKSGRAAVDDTGQCPLPLTTGKMVSRLGMIVSRQPLLRRIRS